MNEVELFIHGTPIAQPRQRHSPVVDRNDRIVRSKKSRMAMVNSYIPKDHKVHAWKKTIAVKFKLFMRREQLEPVADAVRVDLAFVFPRSKTAKRSGRPLFRSWKSSKPDKDNLEKAVLDALSGIAWADDACVVRGEISKFLAGDDDLSGVAIRLLPPGEPALTWADKLICPTPKQPVLFEANDGKEA